MKISVVTVCFNSSKTIADTIHSVASQNQSGVEYIVVDGASTDETLDIINRHRNHINRIISEPDRGIYDAMNKGLRLATGDVIGFLNADDVYANENVLRKICDIMDNNKELDALFGDTEFVNPEKPVKPMRRYCSERFTPKRIAWGWMPAHPSLFFHRRVYERFGGFNLNYRIAGDFELVARVFHQGLLKYRHVPEVWVRMRTGGISTASWRNTIILNLEVYRACRENGIDTNYLKILSKYPVKLLEYCYK